MVDATDVLHAFVRVADALEANRDHLTELDQAIGDGDLGITAGNMAAALREAAAGAAPQEGAEAAPAFTAGSAGSSTVAASAVGEAETADLGKLIAQAGMAVNRAASSSFGTLMATALMRAGKAVRGKSELTPADLAAMLEAADQGIQERGKAKPGDKTVIDVVNPAAKALRDALAAGQDLPSAKTRMLEAAQGGLDSVTPLRSKVGRASWVGERTEGKVDPGGAAGVIILRAIAG